MVEGPAKKGYRREKEAIHSSNRGKGHLFLTHDDHIEAIVK